MSGISIPPTKPTLRLREASAASIATRKLPSCSRNTIDCTFGKSLVASISVNLRSGKS